MSYKDRDWAADDNPAGRYGRPGGDFKGIRPTLDNPFTWALPMGSVSGSCGTSSRPVASTSARSG